MRHDRETLGDELVDSPEWDKRNPRFLQLRYTVEGEDGEQVGRAHPFSAHERNSFFVNRGDGSGFIKMSPISGADSPADARAMALLDYDRDGDQDFAVVNSNNPSFELYRTGVPRPGKFIAVRLTGAARAAGGGESPRSNRDAIGAKVVVDIGGAALTRFLNAGEGYGAQNSKMLIIGLGEASQAESVRVRWPSGQQSSSDGVVRAGGEIRFVEGQDAEIRDYRDPAAAR